MYDNGFDAAVKICLCEPALIYGDRSKLNQSPAFSNAFAVWRALLAFSEAIVDQDGGGNWMRV